jgi:hypothetical protein
MEIQDMFLCIQHPIGFMMFLIMALSQVVIPIGLGVLVAVVDIDLVMEADIEV